MLAFSPYSSICATEVPVRQLRAMAQQMASMSSQPKVAHAGLMKSERCCMLEAAQSHLKISI